MPGPELDTSKLDMEAIQAGRAADEIDMKRLLFPRGKVPIGTKNFLTYYSPAVLVRAQFFKNQQKNNPTHFNNI